MPAVTIALLLTQCGMLGALVYFAYHGHRLTRHLSPPQKAKSTPTKRR